MKNQSSMFFTFLLFYRFTFFILPFYFYLKARAGFLGIKVVVAYDEGFREALLQVTEQWGHRALLGFGARVFGTTVGVEAALVAYADRVGVVPLAVGARLLYGTALVHHAVACYVIMIPDVAEVPVRYVVAATFLKAQALALWRGRAVDDD